MTAHPAWLQSQYDQNRAGSVIVGCSKARVHDTVAQLTPRTRHRTTTHLQRTPNRTEKEQEYE